ncbi:MAG TPA: hypothetical protein VMZ29_16835 [Candidatus Bathyarchaeia archaeon]|nr:hypothetical protein [Candidatus Bathyarchaeia archaeon]
MTFEIVLANRAVKDLEKIEEKIKERIISTLKEYAENPVSHVKEAYKS